MGRKKKNHMPIEFLKGIWFLCDKPGKRLPCLHEQTFAGQRTANGFAVSCPEGGQRMTPQPIFSPEFPDGWVTKSSGIA